MRVVKVYKYGKSKYCVQHCQLLPPTLVGRWMWTWAARLSFRSIFFVKQLHSSDHTIFCFLFTLSAAVGPTGYSDPNSPVQNPGLQQQPDGYRYHAPPPAYGQAVNYGFESK